jgi:hypothetical protein
MSLCAHDDFDNITDEQRIEEITSILAEGVLRLKARHVLVAQVAPESPETGLAICSASCPDRATV